jgi:hypothetical protein
MVAFPPPRLIASFSDQVLQHDLPGMSADRRADVVAFATRRISASPSPMRLGIGAVSLLVAAAGRIVGLRHVVRFLARNPLPLLGDYVRLVRSLGYAYIWETWPSTRPDGSAVA